MSLAIRFPRGGSPLWLHPVVGPLLLAEFFGASDPPALPPAARRRVLLIN